MKTTIEIKVPCSTSNLGPGLDCLGLALSLYIRVRIAPAGKRSATEWKGQGATEIAEEGSNLILTAMKAVYEALDMKCPEFQLQVHNEVPVRAGLGSSGAAIVAGLLAANALCGNVLPREELAGIGTELEGHPDNVSPSLYGGLTISYQTKSGTTVQSCSIRKPPKVAVLLPSATKPSTAATRKKFPKMISLKDAIFNQGRTASIVASLASGELLLGTELFDDRLHQRQRSETMPWLFDAIEGACQAGAFGAFLSGAGPAIAAFCTREELPVILDAMDSRVASYGLVSTRYALDIDKKGARLMKGR